MLIFLLLLGGWFLLVFCNRSLFLSFLRFLIFSSICSSFSLSSSLSFSHFLYSLSPIFVDSLGIAQRLYSHLEFSKKWFLFSCMTTDSNICLSNEVFVYFMTFIPNLTAFKSLISCMSIACLSMWLLVLRFSKSFACSQDLSYTLLAVSPMYLCIFTFSFNFFARFSSPFACSSALAVSSSWHEMHQVSYTRFLLVQSCVAFLPVNSFVEHRRQPFLPQSCPCHGSDLCITSSRMLPDLSVIFSL